MRSTAADAERYRIKVLSRACAVLAAFDDAAPRMTLDELQRAVDVPKPTLFRIVRTLELEGLLVRDDDRYSLGSRVLTLAHLFLRQTSLPRLAEAPFRALARDLGLSISLAMLDDLEVVYLAVENPAHELGLQGDIGRRHPANATAVGKVLLAYLDPAPLAERLRAAPLTRLTPATRTEPEALLAHLAEVRQDGYAVDDEERGIGIRCVAVPIRDANGTVIASMSCAGPTPRVDRTAVTTLVPRLRATADTISSLLGYRPTLTR